MKPKSLISNILKTLMFKKNIKTTQLARELELPQQTLQRIVSGTSPNPHVKTLKPIADYFNISTDQLKGMQPLPVALTGTDLVPQKPSYKTIPNIPFNDLDQYLSDPDFVLPEDYTLADHNLSEKAFASQLEDSSMEPYVHKGSTLIFDPEKEVTDRCFVLVRLADSNTLIFRQILLDGDKQFLKTTSPDFNSTNLRLLKKQDKVLSALVEFRYRY